MKSVTQVAAAPDESATHTFTYNDEVLADNGDYDGFADRTKWDTGEDLPDKSYLDSSVALGAWVPRNRIQLRATDTSGSTP